MKPPIEPKIISRRQFFRGLSFAVAGAIVLPQIPTIFLPERKIILMDEQRYLALIWETMDRLNAQAVKNMMRSGIILAPRDTHVTDPRQFTDLYIADISAGRDATVALERNKV